VRPRARAQSCRRGEDDRRQQHDGRVEAQHGRDHRRHGEDEGQQAPRAAARAGGHQPAHRLEEPFAAAALGEHEQRGQEADGGAEVG
jgi:hypothetical protein